MMVLAVDDAGHGGQPALELAGVYFTLIIRRKDTEEIFGVFVVYRKSS